MGAFHQKSNVICLLGAVENNQRVHSGSWEPLGGSSPSKGWWVVVKNGGARKTEDRIWRCA